jgi:hypothetical protein
LGPDLITQAAANGINIEADIGALSASTGLIIHIPAAPVVVARCAE